MFEIIDLWKNNIKLCILVILMTIHKYWRQDDTILELKWSWRVMVKMDKLSKWCFFSSSECWIRSLAISLSRSLAIRFPNTYATPISVSSLHHHQIQIFQYICNLYFAQCSSTSFDSWYCRCHHMISCHWHGIPCKQYSKGGQWDRFCGWRMIKLSNYSTGRQFYSVAFHSISKHFIAFLHSNICINRLP